MNQPATPPLPDIVDFDTLDAYLTTLEAKRPPHRRLNTLCDDKFKHGDRYIVAFLVTGYDYALCEDDQHFKDCERLPDGFTHHEVWLDIDNGDDDPTYERVTDAELAEQLANHVFEKHFGHEPRELF